MILFSTRVGVNLKTGGFFSLNFAYFTLADNIYIYVFNISSRLWCGINNDKSNPISSQGLARLPASSPE